MPVAGKYSWSETEDTIALNVPLKGATLKTTDVFVATYILKISFPPYLIDLDLSGAIDQKKSRALYEQAELKLYLRKANFGLWGKLLFDGNEKERKERRQKALENRCLEIKDHVTKAQQTKILEERNSLKDQVSRDFINK